jgi:exonuclease VII large subunit
MINESIKQLGQNLVDLAELKIEALGQTLPNKQQTLNELDNSMKLEKPKHLTNEQWQRWLDNGKKIRENFVKSYKC